MKIAFESVPNDFVSETTFYDSKAPVTEALASIRKQGAVIVTKNGEYYGLVDGRSVVRTAVKIGKTSAINKFSVKAPMLDSSTSIEKAIHQFYISGCKALPYYESKKITGVVRREMMLKAILSMHLLSKYKVKDVMSTPIMAIDPDSSVVAATAIMKKNKLNRLVVIANNKVEGMLTYGNILERTGKSKDRSPDFTSSDSATAKVKDVAEENVVSINLDQDIDSAIRTLVENKVSSLLVTKTGKPAGVITIKDIFETVAKGHEANDENIMVSGLDEDTGEFKEEIMTALEKLSEKINKFHGLEVSSIAANVKRHKAKQYEIKLRVWLEHRGVTSVSATGFYVETTLEEAITNAYNAIKHKKEIIYSQKKSAHDDYEE